MYVSLVTMKITGYCEVPVASTRLAEGVPVILPAPFVH
jgi:hypothetical protein